MQIIETNFARAVAGATSDQVAIALCDLWDKAIAIGKDECARIADKYTIHDEHGEPWPRP